MFKDETGEIVPAIVSEELWEKANAVLRRRSADVKNRQGICNHANLLTGKLYCTHCGTPYYRKESKDKHGNRNSKWVCSGKINNGADSCPSFAIYESEIKPLLFDVFQETEADAEALAEEYIKMYQSLEADGNLEKKIDEQRCRIDMATKKRSKLLGFNATGQLPDEEFLAMSKECTAEIKAAEAEIQELEQQLFSKDEFRKHLEVIRKTLRDAQRDASQGLITREFVNQYIDKIFVTPQDDGALQLDIKIFTGESTQWYLQNLASRTGHTFKKMIEAYEKNL